MRRLILLFFATKGGLSLVGSILIFAGIIANNHVAERICGLAGLIIGIASQAVDLAPLQRKWTLLCLGCIFLLGLIGGFDFPDTLGVVCFVAGGAWLLAVFVFLWLQEHWHKQPEKEQPEAV